MPEKVAFRTKPQLARRMLERRWNRECPSAGSWGRSYGRPQPAAVAAARRSPRAGRQEREAAGQGEVRADRLRVEEPGWVRRNGAKGPRVYDWAGPLKELLAPTPSPGTYYVLRPG